MSTVSLRAMRSRRSGAIDLRQRRIWYDDQADTPPPTEPQGEAPDKQPGASDSGSEPAKTFPESYVKELRDEAAKHRREARDAQKRLADLEKAQKDREEAELKDQSKYKELAEKREQEIATLRQQYEAEKLELLRGNVAARYAARLPNVEGVDTVAEFAQRLRGKDEKELLEDAERLIALFGVKSETVTQPVQNRQKLATTSAAPGGQPVGDTDATRRARSRGFQESPMFQKPEHGLTINTDEASRFVIGGSSTE